MTSEVALFRREAMEFQTNQRQWGEVVLLEPVSTKFTAWSLSVAVAVILAFLCFAQYARKESAAGYLRPSTGTVKVFAPQLGTVKVVHVEEGREVQQGQPLLTIETERIAADGQDVNNSVLKSLARQQDVLTRQIEAEERRAVSERGRLAAAMSGIEAEVSHLNAQIELQRELIEMAESLIPSATRMNSKGLMPDAEYKRRQEDVLLQRQKLNALSQQVAARRNQLTETRYSLEQLPVVTAEKVQFLRRELSETEQRMADANGRRAYVIRAPTAGQVSMLQAAVGQTADPRRLQMEIIPAGGVLQAELFIPARAIGFVQVGQKVRIFYEAFPHQKYGTYGGQIVRLSETMLTSSEISGPVALKEPAYKATVELDRHDIDAGGRTVSLRADMFLRADIILEKRSIMGWLIDPFLGAGNIIEMEGLKRAFTDGVVNPLSRVWSAIHALFVVS